MEIRKANKKDIGQCAEIEFEAWNREYPEDRKITSHGLYKQTKDDDYVVLVTKDKNQVMVFLAARLMAWNNSFYVERLFVRATHRRSGIGSSLLAEIKKIARERKLKAIFLDTGNFFKYQKNFYKKNGFEKVGFIKGFYVACRNPKDRDAVVWCYRI